VQWIGVDRGSFVKKGQLIAVLSAPEIVAQKAEAQAKVLSAENQRIAGEAKLAADQSTYQRLLAASKTAGVISDEELETAEKAAEADRARAVALDNTTEAARASLRSAVEMESYLRITAPFDGVVTKRNVHPGALVGPGSGSSSQSSMLRIEQVAHLRLVVAVPEIYALPALSDRVALNITDALLGQYQGEQLSLLHYSTELNQIWLSKDPVALDVLSLQELDRERQDRKIQSENENLGLYQNATLLELGVSDLDKIRLQMVK